MSDARRAKIKAEIERKVGLVRFVTRLATPPEGVERFGDSAADWIIKLQDALKDLDKHSDQAINLMDRFDTYRDDPDYGLTEDE